MDFTFAILPMECTIEKQELKDDDYVLHIKRQDGSVVRVLIPREDVDGDVYGLNEIKGSDDREYGLNLVTNGHYA